MGVGATGHSNSKNYYIITVTIYYCYLAIQTSALPPRTWPKLHRVRNPLPHQEKGTFSQPSLCPARPFWDPLAAHTQLTDPLNSTPASQPWCRSILADPGRGGTAKWRGRRSAECSGPGLQ